MSFKCEKCGKPVSNHRWFAHECVCEVCGERGTQREACIFDDEGKCKRSGFDVGMNRREVSE